MSGSFLLSHSSSLPPACLSGCFLCQPGSTPASPLLGQAAAILSHTRLLWAVAFQRVSINAFCPRGGVCRARPSGWGHIASTFRHCLKPTSPGKGGHRPTPRLPPALHGTLGSSLSPLWALVSWGSPWPMRPRGTGAHSVPCVHSVVVLCCFAKDLYFRHGGIGELPTWQWLGTGNLQYTPPTSCATFSCPKGGKGISGRRNSWCEL